MIDTSSGVLLAIPAELSEGCGPLIAADGRECIEVGPQFSDSFWQGKMASWKQEDAALKAFLDKHEERTVIYVRWADSYPVHPPCRKKYLTLAFQFRKLVLAHRPSRPCRRPDRDSSGVQISFCLGHHASGFRRRRSHHHHRNQWNRNGCQQVPTTRPPAAFLSGILPRDF